ncbi:hypothetical protein BaRGS_00022207 [Batillaria attramentaria]|uniref:Uncharacterized protein n=1 Tax=Batillaria attramentaria TaxID=370345 RepID=A0ABD0KHJ0_9CAEN
MATEKITGRLQSGQNTTKITIGKRKYHSCFLTCKVWRGTQTRPTNPHGSEENAPTGVRETTAKLSPHHLPALVKTTKWCISSTTCGLLLAVISTRDKSNAYLPCLTTEPGAPREGCSPEYDPVAYLACHRLHAHTRTTKTERTLTFHGVATSNTPLAAGLGQKNEVTKTTGIREQLLSVE